MYYYLTAVAGYFGWVFFLVLVLKNSRPRCRMCGKAYRQDEVEGISRHNDNFCIDCIVAMRV